MIKDKIQIITLIVGILAIVILGIIAYDIDISNKKNPAKIEYIKKNQTDITSLHIGLEGKIRWIVDNTEVKRMNLTLFTLRNSGEESILPENIYENISITSPENWEILGVSTYKTNPEGIKLNWKKESIEKFSLEPILINPGDSFEIGVYAIPKNNTMPKEDKINYKWNSRISGLQKISEIVPDKFALTIHSGIVVLLSGWALPTVIILAAVLIVLLIVLLPRAKLLRKFSIKEILIITSSCLISFSVAEVITYFTFRPVESDEPEYANWIVLIIWSMLITYLLIYPYIEEKLLRKKLGSVNGN